MALEGVIDGDASAEKARAFCLSGRGFTRFLIVEPFACRATYCLLRALNILDTKLRAIGIAEIELAR